MQLWTYHPLDFQIDNYQSSGIDPNRGPYCNDPNLRYKSSLQTLIGMLRTNRYPLWCFTVPDCWVLTDPTRGPMEWELSVPEPEILAFINESAWDAILRGYSDDWNNVIIPGRPVKPQKGITAIIQFPLSPDWGVIRRGRVVSKDWRTEANKLKSLSKQTQYRHIRMYRDRAANNTISDVGRRLAASQAKYLEEFLELPNL